MTAPTTARRPWPHGDVRRYWGGCTCDPCKDARRRYNNRTRKLRALTGHGLTVNATGTIRRVQALQAIGWRQIDIAHTAGWTTGQAVHQLMKVTRVERKTARTITAVYDQLSMTPGPSPLTRTRALAAGWASPLAWDDDQLDDPAARPNLGARTVGRAVDLDDWCHLVSLHVNPIEAARRCGVADLDSIETAATRHHHARALRWLAALTLDAPGLDANGRERVDILTARARRLRTLADKADAA